MKFKLFRSKNKTLFTIEIFGRYYEIVFTRLL